MRIEIAATEKMRRKANTKNREIKVWRGKKIDFSFSFSVSDDFSANIYLLLK